MAATDLEVGLKSKCKAQVDKAGSLTLPAKKLFEIIKQLPDAEVRFESNEGDRVLVTCERAQFKLAGMNPKETQEITELIGKLRDEGGYTILVIEHDMHVVEGISDRVVALDHGIKIAEGSFDAVATDPRVVEAYLGTKAATTK